MPSRRIGLRIWKSPADQVRRYALKAMIDLRTTIEGGEVEIARNAPRKHVGRLMLTPTVTQGLFIENGGK
jgi:hypothetical protein